jgi:hypothetical protein
VLLALLGREVGLAAGGSRVNLAAGATVDHSRDVSEITALGYQPVSKVRMSR